MDTCACPVSWNKSKYKKVIDITWIPARALYLGTKSKYKKVIDITWIPARALYLGTKVSIRK